MTISATKILHSISPEGKEFKTALLRYPRFIHAEELTHRVLSSSPEEIIIQAVADGLMYDRNLSRNASSSRAIPVKRLIDDVLRDTAMPIHWGKNQPGMQAREEHNEPILLLENVYEKYTREEAWFKARDYAIEIASAYDKAGYHKQIVNRLLEPFSHINVLVSATEWDNFFELRDHKDAQPEIEALAKALKEAFADSKPTPLAFGRWHLPFVDELVEIRDVVDYLRNVAKIMPTEDRIVRTFIQMSVARCARTSYLTHEGKPPVISADVDLYNRLVGARPLHASPCEHQATPDHRCLRAGEPAWENPHLHGNLVGWIQFRKQLELTTQ